MNPTLQTKLLFLEKNGTGRNKQISKFILLNNPKISKIADISILLNISLSTSHRFIKSLEYPTFIHFMYDYNNLKPINSKIIQKVDTNLLDKHAKQIAKILQKYESFSIVTSRRAKSIGKLCDERLNDANIKHKYFHESDGNLEFFLQKTQKNPLIVFDMSSQSYIVEKTMKYISSLNENKKPKIILITAAKYRKIKNVDFYISIKEINNIKYQTQDWMDYNNMLLDAIKFVHKLLQNIYIVLKLNKTIT